MYEIKDQMILGAKTAATNHSCSNMQNCTSVSRRFLVKEAQYITRIYFNKKPRTTGLKETSYIHK